jgi:aspartate-semialdehyde dehydrogenase
LANSISLVGSESLLGREVRDIVATSAPGIQLRLIAADEEEPGRLTRVGDEPIAIAALSTESLVDADAVILAGSADANRKALEIVTGADTGAAIVDLTCVAEDQPNARLRAPLVEAQTGEEQDATAAEGGVHVIAHPAAIAVALFLRRLQVSTPVRRSVIQIFAPASERGAAGVEELQNQTVSLLSFKPLPQAVFDTQLSFNLLARYGEEAPISLEDSELRIERHLASLLALPGEGDGVPMPSIRLLQAPVFHGYTFSAWVEFDEDPDTGSIEASLASGSIDVRGVEFEPPSNVSQAGQGGITVGAIAPDRNAAEACWFWLAADNLRLAAENAVAVVRELP